MLRRSNPGRWNSSARRRGCFPAATRDWAGFGTSKKLRLRHWRCSHNGGISKHDRVEPMSVAARQDAAKAGFLRTAAWLRLPDWLRSHAPDFGHQAMRVRSVERNIVLPIKGAVIILLGWYLFFSNWFDDVYTFREAVLLTVRLFFLIYMVVNLATAIILMGMDELPFKLIREVALAEAVVDILFWSAMTVVTGGFDSTLYWLFLGLIVRNAVGIPVASTQVVLNLLVCACFLTAGLTEWAITQVEPEYLEETNEPYVLRIAVLFLMTFCCYGLQVLFDK